MSSHLVSSALHPNFNNQVHCCRKVMLSRAPESAATNSASPLLSAIVDCFLLDAVIGYQPSLLRNHDAVPLTLNRSASPAQSKSPYVNTEPTGALSTASRLSDVGCTVMVPWITRRYRRIHFMFPMSVSLARPRLDEASARSVHNSFPTRCRWTLCSLASISFSSFSRRSQRSAGELLSADLLKSSSVLSRCEASTPKLFSSSVFTRVRSSSALVLSSPRCSSSRSRLNSVRISLMIWCVPANNKSSTWNTSDIRFVVCVRRQVSMFGTKPLPEDLLEMVLPESRCASQAIKTFLKFADHCSVARIQCFWLPLGGGFAYTTSPFFTCALRKAVFTSAVNTVQPSFLRSVA